MSATESPQMPEGHHHTTAVGSALCGHLRPYSRPTPDWPCPAGHGLDSVCSRCLAAAATQGPAVTADITDAEARLAVDAGVPARFLELGRLAAEALSVGLGTGLSGQAMWAQINSDWNVCRFRSTPCGPCPDANRWQILSGRFGHTLTGGVVIQRGQ